MAFYNRVIYTKIGAMSSTQIGRQYGIKNKAAVALQWSQVWWPLTFILSKEKAFYKRVIYTKIGAMFSTQIGRQYGIKNKAAIALQWKSNVKL